jgi:uncharacterized membrane protein
MRPIVKTLSYGAMHLTVAVGVAYAVSGDWHVALGIGIIEPAIQTLAYAVHERLWSPRKEREVAAAAPVGPLHAV